MAAPSSPVGPFPPGTDPEGYDRLRRRVLWQLPYGLYLLGASWEGHRNLMTLNWATQVSFDPKLIGVSIERTAFTHQLTDASGAFSLSILSRQDRSIVRRFVRPAEEQDGQLNAHPVRVARTGSPILAAAIGWLDCEVRQRVDCGSHTLFVGEVVDCGPEQTGETGSDESDTGEVGVLRMEDTRMHYGG